MSNTFRHNAGFGKRMEYYVISKMLEQGLDVYIPLIDDFAIDAIVRKKDGTFIEIQIKARSKGVLFNIKRFKYVCCYLMVAIQQDGIFIV